MRATPRALLAAALLSTAVITPAAAQLEVRGDSLPARVFTAAEVAALPHAEVRATEHGGTSTFSGVPLDSLLRRAGVPVDSVRGRRVADYVVVLAADGYRAVFSLAELDPGLGGRAVLVADRRDGQPLGAAEGPLRLVVPGDGRPTRWVRQVTTLVVRRASP